MKYVWLIALREFAENAKTKGFWIGILLFPVMLFLGIRVPTYLQTKAVPTRTFVLIDRSGKFETVIDDELDFYHWKRDWEEKQRAMAEKAKITPEQVRAVATAPKPRIDWRALWRAERAQRAQDGGAASRPDGEASRKRFARVPTPPDVDTTDAKAAVDAMRPYLDGSKKHAAPGERPAPLFALVVIPPDVEETRAGIEYWCANLADNDLKELIERAVNDEVRRKEFLDKGVDRVEVQRIQALAVGIDGKDPRKAAGAEAVSDLDQIRQWVPVGFVYLLWIAIFTVAQMLLNNTVEEKSNRIIEVLVSSVTPTELMFGKLVGIAAVGLTMLSAWIISLLVMLPVLGAEAKLAQMLFDAAVTPSLLVSFVGYFVLGYLLYAGVFLAMGSMVNSLKEAQNLMGAVMLVMMVPLITMMFIPRDPHGTLAVTLSWVPLYTPFVMMNRMAAGPPTFDIVGTTILLLISVVVMIWLSGRIFRIGILRTGQPPKLMELLSWLGRVEKGVHGPS